jgi:hypothetical protein
MRGGASGLGGARIDYMPSGARRAGQFSRGFCLFSTHSPLMDSHTTSQVRPIGAVGLVNRPHGALWLESPS